MTANLVYLLKKNIIIEKRNWKWTFIEVAIISICFLIIVVNPQTRDISFYADVEHSNHRTEYTDETNLYDLTAFRQLMDLSNSSLRLIYSPKNKFSIRITKTLEKYFKLQPSIDVENEILLQNSFDDNYDKLAGIIFNNTEDVPANRVPDKLSITLRFPSVFRTISNSNLANNLWISRCDGIVTAVETEHLNRVDLYMREGFLQLQHRIFLEWLNLIIEQETNGKVDLDKDIVLPNITKSSPYNNTNRIPFVRVRYMNQNTEQNFCKAEKSSSLIWFLYYFSFFLPFLRIIERFASERENNIFAHHWIYGYEYGLQWLTHFAIAFLHFLMLNILIIIFMTIQWTNEPKLYLIRNVNPGILLLFLLLYSTTLILWAIIIATWLSNSKKAMLFGATLWFGSYGLFSIILGRTQEMSSALIVGIVLFFNNTFPYGMRLIKTADTVAKNNELCLLFGIQIASIFILQLILFLLNYYLPGKYKQRMPFNFKSSESVIDEPLPDSKRFEPPSQSCKEVLNLKNVITYCTKTKKMKLKNLNLQLFKGEISVILGTLESGKTDIISLLSGWIRPAAGSIYFDGTIDIQQYWSYYRNYMDVSMSYIHLFDLLTVHETLQYFCELKKSEYFDCEDLITFEVNKWLKILNPCIPDPDIDIKSLSFSKKHLVALCCTMICDTAVVLLDEPTLHMTLPEQRFYWNILQQEKSERCILLTTISIDEAEIIADRIGILIDGCLLAWATPFYLIRHLGIGYDLILLRDPKLPNAPITELLQQQIPNIVPDYEMSDQLIYKIPKEKLNVMPKILVQLEKESKRMGINYIKVRGSTLNEIYMKLGSKSNYVENLHSESEAFKCAMQTPKEIQSQQFRAMYFKKTIQQSPHKIAGIMMFTLYFLILLINAMTQNFDTEKFVNEGIHLGLDYNEKAQPRSLLAEYENCRILEIIELKTKQYNPMDYDERRDFTIEKLNCHVYFDNSSRKIEDSINNTIYGAVEFSEDKKNIMLWINEQLFHSAGLTLNLAHNLILQHILPKSPQYISHVINKPLLLPLWVQNIWTSLKIPHLRLPLVMGIIMPIITSCFIINLVNERSNNLMCLQRIAGIHISKYWLVGFLFDCATFFVYSIILVCVMLLTTVEGFGITDKLLTLLPITFYGIAALSMIYLLSMFVGKSSSSAFIIAILIQLVFGICAYVFYLDVIQNNNFYFNMLSLSPSFSLLNGISKIYIGRKELEYCADRCKETKNCNVENICDFISSCCAVYFINLPIHGILWPLAFMAISSIIFIFLFFAVNAYKQEALHSMEPRLKELGSVYYPCDDEDVINIKNRIANMDTYNCKKYVILADQVESHIPRRCRRLKTISFALNKSTAMCIYGAGHCGKTHLIEQIIGEQDYRFGEVYICGKCCKYETAEAYKEIGYCSQDDELCKAFTPCQMLTLLLMIRGCSEEHISEKISEISLALNLKSYLYSKIAHLPRIVKRKINIALALAIHNKLLILDEPTRGMPPDFRREIWNVMRYTRSCGNAVIFSSRDSLDCEFLADYLIVVNDGEMLALGSPQYLRVKYSKGLFLEMQLFLDGETAVEVEENLLNDVNNLFRYVNALHEYPIFINRCNNVVKFYLPIESISYAHLFVSLERNRHRLNIADYIISHTSFLETLSNIHGTILLRQAYKKQKKTYAYSQQKSGNQFQETGDRLHEFDSAENSTDAEIIEMKPIGSLTQSDSHGFLTTIPSENKVLSKIKFSMDELPTTSAKEQITSDTSKIDQYEKESSSSEEEWSTQTDKLKHRRKADELEEEYMKTLIRFGKKKQNRLLREHSEINIENKYLGKLSTDQIQHQDQEKQFENITQIKEELSKTSQKQVEKLNADQMHSQQLDHEKECDGTGETDEELSIYSQKKNENK